MEHGYIRSDGAIEPASLPIERLGDFYFLKDNIINYTIEIQSNNIVFDGNGFSLALPQGTDTTTLGKYSPALIQISNGSNIVVQNTTFSTYYPGITITNSSKITILGNNFTSGRQSIELRSCSDSDIIGNSLTQNSNTGLFAMDSTHLNIAYNNISRNQNGGCDFVRLAYSNITRNNIMDNSLWVSSGSGIFVMMSANNRFFENNFVNNPTAIIFSGQNVSFNNLIYRNYFHGNMRDILNTGGDAVSGTNESPLGSPASTCFELQLYSAPSPTPLATPLPTINVEAIALVSIIIGVVTVVGLLIYFKKRNK
jgi:parallel beta-helix repeat protein